MEEEVKKETLKIDNYVAPISVSKADAYNVAQKQQEEKHIETKQVVNNVVTPKNITKEELELQRINEINDLMQNEFTEIKYLKHSPKTYIIMILVLLAIICVIVLELIYYLK